MLFVMNIQIFDIYILLLVTPKLIVKVTKMISEGRNPVSTPIINLLYFPLLTNNQKKYSNN